MTNHRRMSIMATVTEGVEMGRVIVEFVLSNNQDVQLSALGAIPPEKIRRVRAQGLVDTGSNHVVLPQTIAEQLGLPLKGEATVRYADQRRATRKIAHELHLELM